MLDVHHLKPYDSTEATMATNFYRCEGCRYIGTTKEFETEEGHRCPNPAHTSSNREDVFPHREYRCDACGFEGDFNHFFGRKTDIDDDPLETGLQATCNADQLDDAGGCGEDVTVTQIR